jgi:hypothetical protein
MTRMRFKQGTEGSLRDHGRVVYPVTIGKYNIANVTSLVL